MENITTFDKLNIGDIFKIKTIMASMNNVIFRKTNDRSYICIYDSFTNGSITLTSQSLKISNEYNPNFDVFVDIKNNKKLQLKDIMYRFNNFNKLNHNTLLHNILVKL